MKIHIFFVSVLIFSLGCHHSLKHQEKKALKIKKKQEKQEKEFSEETGRPINWNDVMDHSIPKLKELYKDFFVNPIPPKPSENE